MELRRFVMNSISRYYFVNDILILLITYFRNRTSYI